VQGSKDVFINGKPAAFLGCKGIHGICCGSNTFEIAEGAPTVFINGYPAARIGDRTSHCGGSGEIKTGSGNVIIGNGQGGVFKGAEKSHAPFVQDIASDRKRSNEDWQQNMQHLAEKGVSGDYHNNKLSKNFIQRSKHRLKSYLDERGVQNYSKGHYVAAYLDAIGSTMLDDVPETAGAATVAIGTDVFFGKAFKIIGKGGKLLWEHVDTLSEPVRTRAMAIMKKAESGKELTHADKKIVTEAVGEIGGQKALARQGITPEESFVNRYHGPDHMGRDVDGNLVETEFKGAANDSTQLPTNGAGQKQLSKKNNANRAKKMKSKAKKVGKASNRIGGAYTEDEITLWEEVAEQLGEKRLISTHTNVETGAVKVIERDPKGKKIETIDSFNIFKD
jgi:uncharacterized Zn-binding protein involved in type VI secretion